MLALILIFELCGFMFATIAIILLLLATGRMTTKGLLTTGYAGADSPARIQVLLVTLGCGVWYLALVIGTANQARMPDVPTPLLALLAGSHATYLGAKASDQLGFLRSFFGSDVS